MMIRFSAVVLSVIIGAVAPAQTSDTVTDLRARAKKTDEAVVASEKRISAAEKVVGEIKEQADRLSKEQKKKFDDLAQAVGKAKDEVRDVKQEMERISADVAKQGKDAEARDKLLKDMQTQVDRLSKNVEKPVDDLVKFRDDIKIFTRMISHRRATRNGYESWVELEDGDKTPLAGMQIEVFTQFKNGPLEPLPTADTDKKGIAIATEPDLRGQPGPMWIVFKFKGDSKYKGCEVRHTMK